MDDPAKSHAVHTSLSQLDEMAKSSQLSDVNDEIDEGRRLSLDRIFYLVGEARRRVSKLNGVRANISVFNNISNSSIAIRQELENYISNRNITHIDNAAAQADQGLAIQLSQLPLVNMAGESQSALESFRKMSRSAVGELKANEEILRQQVVGLQQTISIQDQRLATAQSEILESKQKIESTLATISSSFDTIRTTFESDLSIIRDGQITALEKNLKSSSDLVDLNITQLEDKKKEAAAIVQSVGDILTTGTYKSTAENEAKTANSFRLITICLFSLGILIVISNFVMHAVAVWHNRVFVENPWFLLSRFATALAVALPAFYTARESARHRTNADRARQRQLELMTLGPFIELLPEANKQQIRDRLTDRYFGGGVEAHEIHPPIDPEPFLKIIEAAAKFKPGA